MKKALFILLVVVAGALAGCASIDRAGMSSIEPLKTDSEAFYYRFKAGADAIYRLDSPDAEEIRMEWLKVRLEENGHDRQNFQILSRSPVVVVDGMFGKVHNIFYEVRVPKKSP